MLISIIWNTDVLKFMYMYLFLDLCLGIYVFFYSE